MENSADVEITDMDETNFEVADERGLVTLEVYVVFFFFVNYLLLLFF